MSKLMKNLSESDPKVWEIIKKELGRLEHGIELIPSENYVSKPVLEAAGSILTNKYSEGYPGKRYYGGNEFIDELEKLAINRAKSLFGAEHVNVQPLSGSPANQAVFFALLNPGDNFMGLDLGCGGHLTHGSPVNFSGKIYKCSSYFVDKKTHLLDMDAIKKQAIAEKPKMILSGLTAYPRILDFEAFEEICNEVDAYHFADIAHISGLVVGGHHPSPVPNADVVTTTTHKTLRGPRGAIIMCKEKDRLHEKYHNNSKKNLAGLIDSGIFPGLQGGPHDHINAAKAVCFAEAMKPDFKEYGKQILKNAKALASSLMENGVSLVTGGTDNHLMVADLSKKDMVGKGGDVQDSLDKAGITLNKNTIPFDPSSPFKPSGIRLGTPAITTRGMKESEMKEIGSAIAKVIDNYSDNSVLEKVRLDMVELSKKFPLYPELMD